MSGLFPLAVVASELTLGATAYEGRPRDRRDEGGAFKALVVRCRGLLGNN